MKTTKANDLFSLVIADKAGLWDVIQYLQDCVVEGLGQESYWNQLQDIIRCKRMSDLLCAYTKSDQRFAGFCAFSRAEGDVWAIQVVSSQRRKGLGTLLLQAATICISKADGNSRQPMFLISCPADRPRAVPFLKANGFKRTQCEAGWEQTVSMNTVREWDVDIDCDDVETIMNDTDSEYASDSTSCSSDDSSEGESEIDTEHDSDYKAKSDDEKNVDEV